MYFERTAEGQAWPKDCWAALVAPLLAGDSQKAYFDLSTEDARDFDKLKAEIFQHLGVTTAVMEFQGRWIPLLPNV